MGKYTNKKPRINPAVASQPRTRSATDTDGEYLQLRSRRLQKTAYRPSARRRTPAASGMDLLPSSASENDLERKTNTTETRPCSSSSLSTKNHTISTCLPMNVTLPHDVDVEVEEFLTYAEELLHCHHSDKYNFDFRKGIPMPGGRYEWMEVRP